MNNRLTIPGLRSLVMLIIMMISAQCAWGGLIVVDLESPFEAAVSSSASDDSQTPDPEVPPTVEQGQSIAGEPGTCSTSSFASSAWLPSELHGLEADDVVDRWYRDWGNVHSKIIPFDLLRPPQV